jgi:hypothetical protein
MQIDLSPSQAITPSSVYDEGGVLHFASPQFPGISSSRYVFTQLSGLLQPEESIRLLNVTASLNRLITVHILLSSTSPSPRMFASFAICPSHCDLEANRQQFPMALKLYIHPCVHKPPHRPVGSVTEARRADPLPSPSWARRRGPSRV